MREKKIVMVESKISGGFWGERLQLIAQKVLYRQYEILDGRRDGLLEEQYSHVIENFMIAAGHKKDPYKGYVYSDSELGKWIEAAAYSLLNYPDKKIEEKVDRLVDLIEQVQMEDGYVNTWFQVVHPEKRLQHFAFSCELYNMGHLMEAAVAYYEVTGKRKFLDIMCKTGDLLCDLMKQEKYCHVYDGHAEIELGLFRLYEVTGKIEYLDLSLHFIKERGQQPCFFQQEELLGDNDEGANDKWFGADHHQAHMPVSQQKTAEGHAVKLVYLYTAVADMIGAGMDSGCRLEKAMLQVWDNMVNRRMYVTGAIGSHAYAERFSVDYDLPGDRGYLETCASIGLCFWAKRLLGLYHNAVYADYLELTLYNGVLAGWSLDGNSYFYTNTLHYRKGITDYRQDCGHLEKERQGWFKCACCPSNILRLVASVQKYCIETDEDRIYVNLYAEGYWRMSVGEGVLHLEMETQYPYAGEIKIKVIPQNEPLKTEIALRLPSWCGKYKLMEKGCSVAEKEVHQEKGYLVLKRQWERETEFTLTLDMPVRYLFADERVWECAGKAALARGPLIYCLEGLDYAEGLSGLYFNRSAFMEVEEGDGALVGIPVLKGEGLRRKSCKKDEGIYTDEQQELERCEIKAIPYFAWQNRGETDMDVWLGCY